MGSIEQENSVCWVHRGAACVGHRLRGTASVGGPSGNGMCHRGRRAVHQARRTARVGVHRTRGIGQEEQHVVGPSGKKSNFVGPPSGKKSSVWWPIGPLSKREQLAVGPSGKAACVVSIEQAEQRVVGPWTRRTACGPLGKKNSVWWSQQEEHVLGSIGPGAVCAGGRRTACAGSTAQEEHQQGVWWVHQARRTGVGSIKVMGGGCWESEEKFGGTGRPSGRGLATDCEEWDMGTEPRRRATCAEVHRVVGGWVGGWVGGGQRVLGSIEQEGVCWVHRGQHVLVIG